MNEDKALVMIDQIAFALGCSIREAFRILEIRCEYRKPNHGKYGERAGD